MSEATSDAVAPWLEEGWRFILDLYAQPGISQCCLQMQEHSSVDVMVLLLASYQYVRRGITMSDADIAAADAAVRDWRMSMVQPIRALRRLAKTHGPSTAGATELAQSLLAAELRAERIAWNKFASIGSSLTGQGDSADLVLRVCRYFGDSGAAGPAAAVNKADSCRSAAVTLQSHLERCRAAKDGAG